MHLKPYLKYWLVNSGLTFQALVATRLASVLFMLGKFIRFVFFWWFLIILSGRINRLAGYTLDQLVIFYLVYNLFDNLAQFFYRGVYWYRGDIISGNFDFKLIKPLNPLFKVLTDHTDFLDLPLLVIILVALLIKIPQVSFSLILAFTGLSFSAMLVMTAVHIVVVAVGTITTEVDHTMWIFRDLANMARVPVDIYTDWIRGFLTFIVPVALIFTFPAKVLLGLLSPSYLCLMLLASVFIYWLSLKFWHYALTQYSSASS